MKSERPIIDNNAVFGKYKIIEELGVKSRNSLYKATKKNDVNIIILKAIPYETQEEIEWFKNETEIVELFKNNPLFVAFDDQFEQKINVEYNDNGQIYQCEKNYMFVVMKYYEHNDLGKISELSKKGLNEDLVVKFLYQSLNALKALHNEGIVHHDIKLSNFLVSSIDKFSIALTDFEFAEKLSSNTGTLSNAGTRTFMAPEMLNDESHGTSVDIWGLGVSAYKLAGGSYPYKIISKDSADQIMEKIKKFKLVFLLSQFKNKSADLKNLLSRMLEKDPNKRITPEEALQNKLFDKYRIETENEEEDLLPENETPSEPLNSRRN